MSKKRSILGILLLTVLLLVSGCTKSNPQLTEDNEKDLANRITYLEDQGYDEETVEKATGRNMDQYVHIELLYEKVTDFIQSKAIIK